MKENLWYVALTWSSKAGLSIRIQSICIHSVVVRTRTGISLKGRWWKTDVRTSTIIISTVTLTCIQQQNM